MEASEPHLGRLGSRVYLSGPACSSCGEIMHKTGKIHTCSNCGNNTGDAIVAGEPCPVCRGPVLEDGEYVICEHCGHNKIKVDPRYEKVRTRKEALGLVQTMADQGKTQVQVLGYLAKRGFDIRDRGNRAFLRHHRMERMYRRAA